MKPPAPCVIALGFAIALSLCLLSGQANFSDYQGFSSQLRLDNLPPPRYAKAPNSAERLPKELEAIRTGGEVLAAGGEETGAERQGILGDYAASAEPEAQNPYDAETLRHNTILAYYGSPGAKNMGILGRYSKEEIANQLDQLAPLYDSANGDRGVVKAFYIIYGTCWPGGEIGYQKEAVVKSYIEYAQSRGMIVFLDHQIGKYGIEAAMKRLLPWLCYPNVHLALDPEWRTLKPMKEVGNVTGPEMNQAQHIMQAYLDRSGLVGSRMLIMHQFTWRMISQREAIRSDFERVYLVHCADGFGPPAVKLESYNYNARATNIPIKAYKLFYESGFAGAGFDKPLQSPAQVMSLTPQPLLVMYQ